MASSRRASSRALTALTLGALTAGTLAISPLAQANPAGTGLVISEVYGGGGNTGAVFTHDYVELFNPTSGAVSLDGLSVQYRSATGTSAPTGLVALEPVTLPAGGHFLLQLATTNATVGAALPAPDEQDASVNLSATAGTVLLVNGSSALNPGTGAVQGATGLVDLVGFGGSNTYENLATETELQAQAPSATSSIARTPGDGTDADDSSADFGVRSGAAEMSPAACGNVCVRDVPIAGVQGGGASSPLVGKRVTTRGVVTAAYPVGGLASFVIQTPGTGTSPGGASDAVVVAGAGAVPALSSGVTIGDYVDVTGTVAESFGRTQVTVGAASDVVERTDTVAPPTPLTTTWPGTDSARERLEGMLLAPQGAFTVTDNFNVNRFAEIGIARGTEPLFQPTDVAEPDSPEAAAVAGRNAAALVTLDDGASTDFLSNATNKAIPLPWLTSDPTIRVGEPVTFTKPVVLDFSFGLWRFQPTQQLTADDAHQVSPVMFGDTRTSAPADVGGDLQVASMNVLNYFTDLGEELNGCTYFNDRAGDPVSVSGGCTPRGAAEQEDFGRQQDKIVRAINSLGAEVVSLEEIENSAKYGHPRDESLSLLVDALNGDLGSAAWEYVPTPAQAPPVGGEDFIRTAFIYKPAAVEPVGESVIRPGGDTPTDPFVNARDPLAQVFQPVGAVASDRFMLVVNHLKSKSSPPATPDPNADYGQGGFNADRMRQARALATWVDEVKADRGVEKVYLDGDFNSYTYEDPMRELYSAGFTNLAVAKGSGAHHTYLFGGLVGSLDHGLANDAALASTTGAAVWNINSVESVALEYSRHNYNATLFYDGTTPYRSSDHDPIVFGIDTTPDLPDTTLAVTVGPKNVKVGKTSVVVEASLTREDGAPASDGTVTVSLEGRVLGSVAVSGGEARVTLPPFDRIGEQVLTVDYTGGTSDPASRQVTVTVRR